MTTSNIQYSSPAISAEVPWETRVHLQAIYQKLGNHTQAMSILAKKPAGSTTTNTTVEESITTGGGGTAPANPGIYVNNQSGVTSYATVSGDDGALIVFSDASPVAVSLTTQTPPWSCFIANQGAGTVTLTPNTGTINGAATLTILSGYWALVAFDSVNWWAATLPIVPVTFTAVAHEFLTAYNAATGAFSAAQPVFTDISGVATVAQGGTGTATPGLVAGTNVTITGSWPDQTVKSSTTGLSVTITTAKLTTLGANGSLTFTNGLLVSQVAAT